MTKPMTKEEIDALVEKYQARDKVAKLEHWRSMYEDRSAEVNYAFIREFKPKVVVEYGAFCGRCTHDILKALIDNEEPYVFKSYECTPERATAQMNIDLVFGKKAIKIGENPVTADDLPDEIDYLFLDHNHDDETTHWSFTKMLDRVKKGGLIQIHDIPLRDDFVIGKEHGVFPETRIIVDMHEKGILPFEKLYWLFEEEVTEGNRCEGSWWIKL